MKPSTAITCVAVTITDKDQEPPTYTTSIKYRDLSSDAAFDPAGEDFDTTFTADDVAQPVYDGIENYWSCSTQDINASAKNRLKFVCQLFVPKHEKSTTEQFRFDGSCTDCKLYYVGFAGLGQTISPAISTIKWQSAVSGLVMASSAALASLLVF